MNRESDRENIIPNHTNLMCDSDSVILKMNVPPDFNLNVGDRFLPDGECFEFTGGNIMLIVPEFCDYSVAICRKEKLFSSEYVLVELHKTTDEIAPLLSDSDGVNTFEAVYDLGDAVKFICERHSDTTVCSVDPDRFIFHGDVINTVRLVDGLVSICEAVSKNRGADVTLSTVSSENITLAYLTVSCCIRYKLFCHTYNESGVSTAMSLFPAFAGQIEKIRDICDILGYDVSCSYECENRTLAWHIAFGKIGIGHDELKFRDRIGITPYVIDKILDLFNGE